MTKQNSTQIGANANETIEKNVTASHLISDGWSHIFDGRGERVVRFVYEIKSQSITAMQEFDSVFGWRNSSEADMNDVLDSLLNANEEAFSEPDDYNCEYVNDLPDWSR